MWLTEEVVPESYLVKGASLDEMRGIEVGLAAHLTKKIAHQRKTGKRIDLTGEESVILDGALNEFIKKRMYQTTELQLERNKQAELNARQTVTAGSVGTASMPPANPQRQARKKK